MNNEDGETTGKGGVFFKVLFGVRLRNWNDGPNRNPHGHLSKHQLTGRWRISIAGNGYQSHGVEASLSIACPVLSYSP